MHAKFGTKMMDHEFTIVVSLWKIPSTALVLVQGDEIDEAQTEFIYTGEHTKTP
jgi:hypothetical protein